MAQKQKGVADAVIKARRSYFNNLPEVSPDVKQNVLPERGSRRNATAPLASAVRAQEDGAVALATPASFR
jgi:hypothetical protein